MSQKDGSGGNPQEGAPPPGRMTEEMTAAPKPPRAVPPTVIDGAAAPAAAPGPSSASATQVDAADPWEGHAPELQPRSTGTNTAVDAASPPAGRRPPTGPSDEPARATPPPPTAPDPRPPLEEPVPPTVGQSGQRPAAANTTVGQAPEPARRGTELSDQRPQGADFHAGGFPATPARPGAGMGVAPVAFAAPAYGPPMVRRSSGMGPSALLIIGGLFLAVLLFVGVIGAVVALRGESSSSSDSPPLAAPTPTPVQPTQPARTTAPIVPATDPVSAAPVAKPKTASTTKTTSGEPAGTAGSGSTTSGEKKPEGEQPPAAETKPSGETTAEPKPQGDQPAPTGTSTPSGQGGGNWEQPGQAGSSGGTRRGRLGTPKAQLAPGTTPPY